MHWQRAIALCAGSVLAGGCSSFAPKLEPPAVELVSVDLAEAKFRRQRFDIVLRLTNPNDRDIPVKSLDYQIRLAGSDFATGRSTREFTLPAYGEADLQAQLSTDLVKSVFQMLRWMEDSPKELDYEVQGRIDTGGWFGAIPFSESGQVALH